MDRSTVALIIPFFGSIPDYFDLWAQSAGKNPDFDFLIFSDLDFNVEQYNNIHVINISFSEVCRKFKKILGDKIILHEPYKLCDYKPAYGLVFYEYIKDYDFWGFCDIDLIFGNIGHFITSEVLSKYNKILALGHFCLLKNEENINRLFMQKFDNVLDCNTAFYTNYNCHFDENGTIAYADEYDSSVKLFFDWTYFDVNYKSYKIFRHGDNSENCFLWENGKLTGYWNNGNNSEEYMYVHLQKRKMFKNFDGTKSKFLIFRNEFLSEDNITVPDCLKIPLDLNKKKEFDKTIKRRLRKIKFNDLKNGYIKYRFLNLKNKWQNERQYTATKINNDV